MSPFKKVLVRCENAALYLRQLAENYRPSSGYCNGRKIKTQERKHPTTEFCSRVCVTFPDQVSGLERHDPILVVGDRGDALRLREGVEGDAFVLSQATDRAAVEPLLEESLQVFGTTVDEERLQVVVLVEHAQFLDRFHRSLDETEFPSDGNEPILGRLAAAGLGNPEGFDRFAVLAGLDVIGLDPDTADHGEAKATARPRPGCPTGKPLPPCRP